MQSTCTGITKAIFSLLISLGVALAPCGAVAAEVSAASYDQAIRCAAIDTLIASVYSGVDVTEEETKLASVYDKLIVHWIDHAISLQGKSRALEDYQAASASLTDQVKKALSDTQIEQVIYGDMATCAKLENAMEDVGQNSADMAS